MWWAYIRGGEAYSWRFTVASNQTTMFHRYFIIFFLYLTIYYIYLHSGNRIMQLLALLDLNQSCISTSESEGKKMEACCRSLVTVNCYQSLFPHLHSRMRGTDYMSYLIEVVGLPSDGFCWQTLTAVQATCGNHSSDNRQK
jgi:hypothetical protein